jgi:anti-sigma factor ChrR (cupin superfamily)
MVLLGEPSNDGFYFVNAEQVAWRPSAFAPRIHVKDLGSSNGRFMQLVRYEPGASFPVHRHLGPEFIYVLEGELIQHGRRLGPGWAAVADAGTTDVDVRTESGCTFLTVYSE